MNKKVGIITFHSAHNYGAMLQVFALQEVIKKNGINDVKIIDYRNEKIDKQYKVFNIMGKNPIKIAIRLKNSLKYYKKNKNRYKAFDEFMKSKLNLSNRYNSIKELKLNPPEYDIYITGSDQVWNPNIVGELSDCYTLNFGNEKVKRISYAASIGNSSIDEKYIEQYKRKLNIIDCISVREESAKNALKDIVKKDIEVVLDPTMLLKKEHWDKQIEKCNNEKEKYILAYVVEENEEYRKIVNFISEKTGLKVIHFEKQNKYDNILRSGYENGPLEFVNLIKNAEIVIATSFHATVFSILYNKNFFVIPHKKTGSRVTNILNKLGINDRIYYNLEEFKNINFEKINTNWEDVENKLEIERKKSIKFLLDSIDD